MNYYYLTIVCLNFFFIIYFRKLSSLLEILDKPNEAHKIHKNKIPVIGGILMFINILFLLGYLLLYENTFFSLSKIFSNLNDFLIFFLIYSLFFIKGVYDDVKNINANIKFIFSIIFIFGLLLLDSEILIKSLIFSDLNFEINLHYIKTIFTIFCFISFINAMNMFDGINLQVSLYSIFIVIFLIFNLGDDIFLTTILIFLIFFCYLNFKSKCFLGDGGSLGLGFIFSYIFVKNYNVDQIILSDEILLIMLIPGLELIRLTISRLLKLKHPFKADKNHLHHLLIEKIGLQKTLFISMSLIITPVIINELTKKTILTILLYILFYILCILYIKKK